MASSGPAPDARLAYGSARSQYVELFVPQGEGPFPVVVLLHGGCWLQEHEGIVQMRNIAGALRAQGIAVGNVEYRRIDEAGGGYPGTYQDAAAAFDLLVAHAAAHHLDVTRLLAMGHSAGGHLVQWLAGRSKLPATSPLYRADPFPVHRVIGLGSIGDLERRTAAVTAVCGIDIEQLTGRPSAARRDVYADTNPAQLLPNGSHTVLINGDLDHVSPAQTAADYAARARLAGDQVDTIVLPNAGHFDVVSTTSPAWPVILPVILEALGMQAPD